MSHDNLAIIRRYNERKSKVVSRPGAAIHVEVLELTDQEREDLTLRRPLGELLGIDEPDYERNPVEPGQWMTD